MLYLSSVPDCINNLIGSSVIQLNSHILTIRFDGTISKSTVVMPNLIVTSKLNCQKLFDCLIKQAINQPKRGITVYVYKSTIYVHSTFRFWACTPYIVTLFSAIFVCFYITNSMLFHPARYY